jgi:hypothetical protein
MTQREVSDHENTTWSCVQAYSANLASGSNDKPDITNENGTVTVVCTPSGGAQTVRLELTPDWIESISEVELVQKITEAK